MAPMEFHGIHELFMVSTKFSWNPRSFHGIHEVSMDSTKFSWSPRSFHGLHEVFMESTKFSWIPRNFHGIHEGRGIHENSPRNFHEVRGIHGKANWIVPLGLYSSNMVLDSCEYSIMINSNIKSLYLSVLPQKSPCLLIIPHHL